MADDETIVIRVDSKQAEAALKALGDAGIQTGKDLETIGDDGGANVQSLGNKSAEATPKMEGFGKSAQNAGLNVKDLTKSIGAGISIIGILQENLRALEPALEKVGNGIKFAFESAGADKETMTNLGRALDSLIHPSHIAANAVESLEVGWRKLIDTMEESSTVVPRNSKSIEDSLAILKAAREQAAEATEESSATEEKALRDVQKAEEDLEKAAIRSAEERAKAEAAAAESIKQSLEAQRVAREAMLAQLDAEILAAEERLKKQTTGGTVVEEFLPEGAPEEVKALKDEMRSLENQPFLDSGQQQRVEELKNKIADAGSQILKTYGVWKATNEMADGTHEAFNAAWDAYIARLNKSEVQHQNVMDDLQRLEGGYDDLGGTVDDVGGSFEDIAEAAGDLGKEAKKGTDAAKEGLDGLKAGAEEVIPLLEQINGLLAEIKQAASEVEL